MIAINGIGSAIAKALIEMLPEGEEARRMDLPAGGAEGSPGFTRYVFLQGLLPGMALGDHNDRGAGEVFAVNFVQVAQECDAILETNPQARIVVVGSESGFSGSYDMAYAGAKAALHLYVETKRLQPGQQLVGVAPSIVSDAGMTTRRTDTERLAERRTTHPKGRFLMAREVARLIHFLLYRDEGYLSGTVIRMHGGERACR